MAGSGGPGRAVVGRGGHGRAVESRGAGQRRGRAQADIAGQGRAGTSRGTGQRRGRAQADSDGQERSGPGSGEQERAGVKLSRGARQAVVGRGGPGRGGADNGGWGNAVVGRGGQWWEREDIGWEGKAEGQGRGGKGKSIKWFPFHISLCPFYSVLLRSPTVPCNTSGNSCGNSLT